MRIGPPTDRREQAAALACLLGEPGDGEGADRVAEALALSDAGTIDLSGLIAAWDEDRAVGATLYTTASDRSAFVWPAEVRSGPDRDALAIDLLKFVLDRADQAGCRFAQSAVDIEQHVRRADLERAGFRYLTDLLHLQRPLDSESPAAEPIRGRVLTYRPRNEQRFADVIRRTYVGSRDCPAFAGFRTPAEALRSYRDAGTFTPRHWRLFTEGGQDVAVLLVNDQPDDKAREIVYLGVVPEARRGGLARALLTQVLDDAKRDRCESVLSAVDSSNLPAVNLYNRLGFFPVARRAVYLKRFGEGGESPFASE